MIIIFVYVFPLKPPLFLVPKPPFYLPLVLHALEKNTRIHNTEPSLLKVKPFDGASDFSYLGFQIHIFFVSLRNFHIVNFKFSYTEKKKHDSVASGKEWFMSEDENWK